MSAVTCRHCGQCLTVTEATAGRTCPCPGCGAALEVPPLTPAAGAADGHETGMQTPRTAEGIESRGPGSTPASTLTDAGPALVPPLLVEVVAEEGAAVAGYDILAVLGRGGMGVVYKARQVKLNRVVALKMILAGAHAGPAELTRFRTEAEAIASLQHPNVVQIHDVGEQNGQPYFALEFVDGGSLEQRLTGTPHAPRKAAQLVETLARAVHAAHGVGIIHRDLKPANVLLTRDGQPKITDFGLAKRLGSETGQTQSGAIVGTPSYMAPEQAAGKVGAVGPAADTYALGAILYELLTGRPPFKAETPMDTLLQVLDDEPVRLRRLNSKIPVDLETICLKCLEKQPHRRYHSARALADDLHRFLEDEPIRARPMTQVGRMLSWMRRRPAVAALLGVSLVALLSVIGGGVAVAYNARLSRAMAETLAARQREQEARLAEDKARHAEEEQKRINEAAAASNLYAKRLALAERDLAAGNVARAERLLADLQPTADKPDLRHWEWHYLKRLCHAEEATLKGHSRDVVAVAYDPGGTRLVAASWDNTVSIWDVAGRRRLHVLKGHTNWVRGVAFRPDGKRLTSVSDDGTIQVWDPATGANLGVLAVHTGPVTSVAYSPDGRRLISGGADGTVRLCDADDGQHVVVHKAHTGRVTSVVFGSDGHHASAGMDRTVRLWDPAAPGGGRVLRGQSQAIHCVAFSPDGRLLASASEDRTVRLWEAATGHEVVTLLGHNSPVRGLAFSPDSRRLATAGNVLKVWDVKTAEELATLRGHGRAINGVAFSPDGRHLATAGADATVKLWSATDNPEVRRLTGHLKGVADLAFSPDGKRLAAAGGDGNVRIWDVATGREERCFRKYPDKDASCVAFSPDGKRLLSCSDYDLTMWDLAEGRELYTIQSCGARAVFSPDGKTLATADYTRNSEGHWLGYLSLWNADGGAKIRSTPELPGMLFRLVFSPDGTRIAGVVGTNMVLVADIRTVRPELIIVVESRQMYGLAYSPDGRRLYADAGGFNTPAELRVWDTRSGGVVMRLLGHEEPVFALALSGDGKRLASVSADKTVRLWDTAAGIEVFSLRLATADGECLAFSPDGRHLATAGKGDAILVWEAAPR
jgi:WD40 repeat protein/tRNA A-37 threonylcarbamoyl transferase component Bud32